MDFQKREYVFQQGTNALNLIALLHARASTLILMLFLGQKH